MFGKLSFSIPKTEFKLKMCITSTLSKTLCMSQRLLVLPKIIKNILLIDYSLSRQNLVRTSTVLMIQICLGTHLHIGLKLCILTGNSEILIKSDLLN